MPSAHRRLCRSALHGRNENGLGQSTTKPRPAAALPPSTEDQSPVSCCKQEGAAAFGQRSNHVLLQLVTRLQNRARGRGRGRAGRGEAQAGVLVRNTTALRLSRPTRWNVGDGDVALQIDRSDFDQSHPWPDPTESGVADERRSLSPKEHSRGNPAPSRQLHAQGAGLACARSQRSWPHKRSRRQQAIQSRQGTRAS